MNAVLALGLIGSLAMFVFVFELLRRRHLREKYAILWITVALASLMLTFFPGTLTWLSGLLGVEVPSNLLFFLALMLLLLTSIQHSFEVGRLEEKTRTLAEETALLRLALDEREDRDRPQH
ncbi:DUF2304 domain-containing protein [Aeromicrobium choanae]|uniref:DUF2304 domain-containing protein n=1 Tax=Aeromicrobium choanae TaxID=1736691 RepID=A0A1T4YYZ4_9ACTN|nr:DUF2304 domain-containing protein [Aeromicrobium choanae]SKB06485.1 hypothetical protein SAMN06295964_1331 [Aeromicrobium choanae]